MDRSAIVRLLVEKGENVFEARDSFVEFTKHAGANNDVHWKSGHEILQKGESKNGKKTL